ncbi:Probable carbohydrate esterase At4g34215 [Linum perenne]
MAFSKVVRERLGEGGGVIGVVPCGVGGTAIAKWARGEELYENMVKRAKESVKCGGEGAEIKCLLWCQGESDTTSEHVAAAYRGNFEKLIQHVREHRLKWLLAVDRHRRWRREVLLADSRFRF